MEDRAEAAKAFLDHLAWERGLSRNTVSAYAGDIARLVSHLDSRGAAKAGWQDVTAADLRGFFESEAAEKGFSATTRARRMAAIRGFFAFMRSEGFIRENPAATLSPPRKPRNLPHCLSEKQVSALLRAPASGTPEDIRDRALLELVYGCGLRAGEGAALALEAVKFDAGLVRVVGKGSKVRNVPLGSKAEAALLRYIEEARPAFRPAAGQSALFVGKGGRPLGRRDVWAILKKRAAQAGVSPAASPHWLRHSFATHMLGRGAPIRVIQELLGHADISTTQIYAHADSSRLAAAVRSAHPRA